MGRRVKREIKTEKPKEVESVSIRFEGQNDFIAFNVSEKEGIKEIVNDKENKEKDEKKTVSEHNEEHSSFAEQFINAVKKKEGIVDDEKEDEEIVEDFEVDENFFVYNSEDKGRKSILAILFTLVIIIPFGAFGFYLGQKYAEKHDEELLKFNDEYMYDILNLGYSDEQINELKDNEIRAYLTFNGVIMYNVPEIQISKYNVFEYNNEDFLLNINGNILEINNDNGTLFRYEYRTSLDINVNMYSYNNFLVLQVYNDVFYTLQVLDNEFLIKLNVKNLEEGIVTFSSTDIYYGELFCPNKMFDIEPQISIHRFNTNNGEVESFGVLKNIPDGACNY